MAAPSFALRLAVITFAIACGQRTAIAGADYLAAEPPPRIALVIGNRDYEDPLVDPALNAINDLRAMARKLHDLSFDTVTLENASYETMYAEFSNLRDRRVRGQVVRGHRPLVVVYYSGHGFNVKGRAYIAGTNASNNNPLQKSLAIDSVLNDLAEDSILVVLLDSCRSELVSTQVEPSQHVGSGVSDDTGDIGPLSFTKATGNSLQARLFGHTFLVGYAALHPGDTAANSTTTGDLYSPYTWGLVKNLGRHQEQLSAELGQVKHDVRGKTQGRQQPDTRGDPGAIYLRESAPHLTEMRQKWGDVIDLGDRQEVLSFLVRYPTNHYSFSAFRWLADDERGARE